MADSAMTEDVVDVAAADAPALFDELEPSFTGGPE